MSRMRGIILAAVTTALSLPIGGCGRGIPGGPGATVSPRAPAVVRGALRILAEGPLTELSTLREQMYTSLNVSEAQRAHLKAITAKYLLQVSTVELQTKLRHLKEVMTAPQLDVVAAKVALSELKISIQSLVPQTVALAGERRDVLTPEQRSMAIAMLSGSGARLESLVTHAHDRAFTALAAHLDLNTEQASGLEAVRAQSQADHQAAWELYRGAAIRFLLDGNQQTLSADLHGLLSIDHRDAAIAWAATLSQGQRQQLAANVESYLTSLSAMANEE